MTDARARAAAVAIIKRITIGDPEVWLAEGSSDREELVSLIANAVMQAGKEKEKEILALAAQVADEKDESIRVLTEDREKWFNRCEFKLAPQVDEQAEKIARLLEALDVAVASWWDTEPVSVRREPPWVQKARAVIRAAKEDKS